MAEIVQRTFESSIKSLISLEKHGIFNSSEVKQILEKRQKYEYRLRKVEITLSDYLVYISYEKSLLHLIRLRCDKLGIEIDRNNVERTFVLHIQKLYEAGQKKFQSDITLWLSYLDFTQHERMLDLTSAVFFRALQLHGHREWLWIKHAKFEFEEKGSSETARKVFQQALSFHLHSMDVWYEYFKFELLYYDKIRKRAQLLIADACRDHKDKVNEIMEEQTKDAAWDGKLATIVYHNAVNEISGLIFGMGFINICHQFDYDTTREVKKVILEDLKLKYSQQETFWDLLARDKFFEYKQFLLNDDFMNEESRLAAKMRSAREASRLYSEACKRFDNAVMWECYFRFRFQILAERHCNDVGEELAQLMSLLDHYWNEDSGKKISVGIYSDWVHLYYESFHGNGLAMHRLSKLLMEGAHRWPKDLNLHFYIGCYLTRLGTESAAVVQKYFDDCLLKKFRYCSQDCDNRDQHMETLMEMWMMYLDWALLKKIPTQKILKIFNDLGHFIRQNGYPRKISEYFKPKMLAINYHLFGIKKARLQYEQGKSVPPICKSFFYRMIEIERHFGSTQEYTDNTDNDERKTFINIYEDLVHYFGAEDVQVWLDYVQLISEHDPSNIASINQRAIKCLSPPERCHEFVQKYNLLREQAFIACKNSLGNAKKKQ